MVELTKAAAEAFLQDLTDDAPDGIFPATVGGSVRLAAACGEITVLHARHGNAQSAYWFARWGLREAMLFFDMMDKKIGTQFKLHDNVVRESRGIRNCSKITA